MKNLTNLSFILVIAAAVVIDGCKSKEKLPTGETEVVVPCSGPEYFTTKDAFRANSIGESMDQVTSKKKALTNARNELAQAINTTVKTVTDNYVNSRTMNNKEDLEQKFESLPYQNFRPNKNYPANLIPDPPLSFWKQFCGDYLQSPLSKHCDEQNPRIYHKFLQIFHSLVEILVFRRAIRAEFCRPKSITHPTG